MACAVAIKLVKCYRLIAFVLPAFSIGCGSGFVHDERITGPYRLIAVDVREDMAVCYDLGGNAVGRIEPTVISVGWNDRYIVAKQRPPANPHTTNYFVLDMTRDSKYADPLESVTGPLSESEFTIKAKELQLPEFRKP